MLIQRTLGFTSKVGAYSAVTSEVAMSQPISVSELFLRLQPQLVSLSQTFKKNVKERFNRAQECFGEVKNSINETWRV